MSNKDASLDILKENLSVCFERVKRLVYSINKNNYLYPLSVDALSRISDEQLESVDSMILRYSQCVSIMQEKIFRGIALVEQEDMADKSNRDKSLLMEKLGALKSADEFGDAVILRNKFSHSYSTSEDEQASKLNALMEESRFIVEAFFDVIEYVANKNLLGINDVNQLRRFDLPWRQVHESESIDFSPR